MFVEVRGGGSLGRNLLSSGRRAIRRLDHGTFASRPGSSTSKAGQIGGRTASESDLFGHDVFLWLKLHDERQSVVGNWHRVRPVRGARILLLHDVDGPKASLKRPAGLPRGDEAEREAIRRLNPAIPSRTLATPRDTLLPKLLSGELSVAGALQIEF